MEAQYFISESGILTARCMGLVFTWDLKTEERPDKTFWGYEIWQQAKTEYDEQQKESKQ